MQDVVKKPASRTRQVTAAVIGNALEWYDFIVYGFVAKMFADAFFPSDDPSTSLLKALSVFGVGFFMRPVGGILLGIYADRKGRKAALQMIIILMTIAIALMTFAPPYTAIGLGAPIIIVIARMLQGFATGGEFASATAFLVESAPGNRRGLYGSWQLFGQCLAVFAGNGMGALVTGLLEPEAVSSWGWRVPFAIGLLIAPVGLWIRKHMEETEDFVRVSKTEKPVPLLNVLRDNPRSLFVTLGSTIVGTATFYVILVNMPNFATTALGLPSTQVFIVQMVSVALMTIVIPLAGLWSDMWGRKPVLVIGSLGVGVLIYPLYTWLAAAPSLEKLLVTQLLLCLFIGISYGPAPTAMAEQWTTRVRSSGIAVAYNMAVMLFGGFAPFLVTWLVKTTNNPVSAAWYVLLGVAIGLVSYAFMRDASPAAQARQRLRDQAAGIAQ